ncbi:hypothetical protein L1987_78886 [Smallanthus sonchifolius]|uniref:Uncharacterized protein n=1 Tax=Smallanthus sonchifolius TaxID=185202 RepID=A0ACB8ZEZ5_9ASTR|nr:hypothetical protein L1987_78886 [Smallanthus sonchifolius]
MKRTIPEQPLNTPSSDDDEPSPSNGTKDLAGGKRPKNELITVINPDNKVVTEGNLITNEKSKNVSRIHEADPDSSSAWVGRIIQLVE